MVVSDRSGDLGNEGLRCALHEVLDDSNRIAFADRKCVAAFHKVRKKAEDRNGVTTIELRSDVIVHVFGLLASLTRTVDSIERVLRDESVVFPVTSRSET